MKAENAAVGEDLVNYSTVLARVKFLNITTQVRKFRTFTMGAKVFDLKALTTIITKAYYR